MKRRTVLGLAGGAVSTTLLGSIAAAPQGAAQAASRKAAAFDPADPDQLALAFRKLAHSLDDSLTWWWLHGTRYGIVGSVATPLWDMHVGTWLRTRDLPDGRYEVKSAGANFYTLPGETKLLERFANPYTGKTVDVPYGPPRASVTLYDRKGGSPFANFRMPGMKIGRQESDFGPAWVHDDEVMVRGDFMLHAEPEDPSRPTFTVNDWSTYVGKLTDVADPRVQNPPCAQDFNDILDFPAWLQMPGHPGTYYSRCFGRKVFRYEQMPAQWRTLFEGRLPQEAKDPGGLLA